MPPIFYSGYYPGTRPIKKKRGGGRPPIENPDPFIPQVTNTFSFDNDVLGLPQAVSKNLEADWNKQFRLIFIGDDKESTTAKIEELGTDITEYEELPGALGVSFNLKTLKEKGLEAAAAETLKSLSKSIFTFKDLGAQAERRGIWEPSLFPDRNKVNEELSLGSDIYIEDWRKHPNYAGLVAAGEYRNSTDLKDWANFGVVYNPKTKKAESVDHRDKVWMRAGNEVDFRHINTYRDKILDLIQFGSAERAEKLGDVQAAYIDSLEVVLKRNPKVLGGLSAADDAKLDNILGRIKVIQDLEEKLKKKSKGRKKFGDFLSYSKDKDVRELLEKVKLERNSFWYSTVGRRPSGSQLFDPSTKHNWYDPSLGKDILGFDEVDGSLGVRKLVAWAQLSDFRSEMFRYNEFIDNIAEGNVFKNMIWAELNRTRFKYFTPQYYTTHFIRRFLGYEGYKTQYQPIFDPITGLLTERKNLGRVYSAKLEAHELRRFAKLFNRLMMPINRAVKAATDLLMKIGPIRGAFNLLSGRLIKNLIDKAAAWVIGGLLSSTGFGAVLAPIVAPLVKMVSAMATYVFEKVMDVLKAAMSGDLDFVLAKVADEIARLFKCCVGVFLFGCLGTALVMYIAWGTLLYVLTGSTTGDFGGGSVPGGPGGPGVPGGSTGGGVTCNTNLIPQDLPDYFIKTAPNPIGSKPSGGIGTMPGPVIASCMGECRDLGGGRTYLHGGIDLNGVGNVDNNAPVYSPYDGDAVVIATHDGCTPQTLCKDADGNYYYCGPAAGIAGSSCSGFGNFVLLGVDNIYFIYLAHLVQDSVSVTVGQTLHKGDFIGQVDNSGSSYGAHLHYEIHSGGAGYNYAVNPCYFFDCSKLGGGYCPTTIDGQ